MNVIEPHKSALIQVRPYYRQKTGHYIGQYLAKPKWEYGVGKP